MLAPRMSGNNTDFEFGEVFSLDFELEVRNDNNKRGAEAPRSETPKRQKIFTVPKNVVRRKFPGPAGILPDRRDSRSVLCEASEKDTEAIPCSQMSVSVFQSSPWLDVIQDYELLMEKYDIKWIKLNAALNKLPNHRAPFLGAVIQSIECFEGKNVLVKVVLKDVSGEVHGTITQSLYEEYSNSLVAGSVIVLRQCGVLTTIDNGNHYLTIIPKNLVAIYYKTNDSVSVIKVQEVSCQDLISDLKGNVSSVKNKQISKQGLKEIVQENNEDLQMMEDALEGVDMNSFFEDF